MRTEIYSIHNLDCANCAAKAEAKIRALPGVEDATITFATMQLRLTAQDPDTILPAVLAAARQVEPDIEFTEKEDHHSKHCHDHDHHDHDHHDHHEHQHHCEEKTNCP